MRLALLLLSCLATKLSGSHNSCFLPPGEEQDARTLVETWLEGALASTPKLPLDSLIQRMASSFPFPVELPSKQEVGEGQPLEVLQGHSGYFQLQEVSVFQEEGVRR